MQLDEEWGSMWLKKGVIPKAFPLFVVAVGAHLSIQEQER
jgi:hypothetical protein